MTVELASPAVNPLVGYLTAAALVSGSLMTVSGTGSNVALATVERADLRDESTYFSFHSIIAGNSYTGTSASVSQISHNTQSRAATSPQPLTSAELVKQVHIASGLTWEQLAKVFGVSRRALHQWASGNRMNSTNLERLAAFNTLLSELKLESPEERRSALFTPDSSGMTSYDKLRAARASSAITVSEPLWNLESLAGGKASAIS